VRVAFLRWPRLSASTSTHGRGDSACSAITKRKMILVIPCKAVPKAKQDGSVITIASHTTSTRHGSLLCTAVRWEETHCDACTPTTSPPMKSAHTATSKDACWELQQKRRDHAHVEGSSPPRMSCVYPRACVCMRECHVSVCVRACVLFINPSVFKVDARPSPCCGTIPLIIACVSSPRCHDLYKNMNIIA